MKSSAFQSAHNEVTRASAHRISQRKSSSLPVQAFSDRRPEAATQMKLNRSIQMMGGLEEEDLLQGKFETAQMAAPEEEELLQGKFGATAPLQKQDNTTGMPAAVQSKMESAFNTDFSDVNIHANSAAAPKVGALAYTQGTDVHFAPGQFKPDTTKGQELLGHELTHVVQQRQGIVKPTTQAAGLPVNDDPGFERAADIMGKKAAQTKVEE